MLVRSFLSAGVDTTVNGLGNALLCLAQNPVQMEKLHADPSLARSAFEESLRLESAVQTFFRTTPHAVDIDGLHIPQDTKVLTFLGTWRLELAFMPAWARWWRASKASWC